MLGRTGWILIVSAAATVGPWLAGREQPAAAAAVKAPVEVAQLAALHADPVAQLGNLVRVQVQVDAELAQWNAYLTRFGAGDYRAWRVWGDEQFLWRSKEWENPLGQLYVRRGAPVESVLARAPRYSRFEITGRVRQVFLGRPWIEVESAVRLGAEVDEPSLVHAGRAVMLMESERWRLAIEDIDRALAGNLPSHAREELWRLRAECREHSPR